MQSLTTEDNQQTPPKLVAEEEETKRRPLVFDPEPAQRMVVVRRRRKRRTRKTDKTERLIGRIRLGLLVVIVAALILKLAGNEFLSEALGRLRAAVHPMKAHLHVHAPDIEVIVLVIVALGLLYTIPGIQIRVNRALGIGTRRS